MFGGREKSIPGVPYDIQRIYDQLTPKPKELLQNAFKRRFIKEGEVGVYNAKERRTKRRHFFLFNDVLLITKREGKQKFWLKIYVSLRSSLKVEDVPDSLSPGKVEFRIYAPKKTFILFARTNEEKHVWLKDIKGAINGEFERLDGDNSSSFRSDDFSYDSYDSNQPVDISLGDQPKQAAKYELSGNIGSIDIPGVNPKRLSGDNSGGLRFDSSSDDDDLPSAEFKVLGISSDSSNPFSSHNCPPTPSSTPITGGMLDDFSAIAARMSSLAPPSNSAQPFASSQPLNSFGAPQPFASSQPLQPSLQPAPFASSQPFANVNPLAPNPLSSFAPIQPNSSPQPFAASQPLQPSLQPAPFASSQPFGVQPFASSQPLQPAPFASSQQFGVSPFASSQPLQPSPFSSSQPLQPSISPFSSSQPLAPQSSQPFSNSSQLQMGNFAALKGLANEPNQPPSIPQQNYNSPW